MTHQKQQADDWIILLDHSIQFGCEKILVILGIRERDFLKLNRPLQYTDLNTLLIANKKSWNGALVASELERLESKIGKIKYAVADYGSDLRKGLVLEKIPHIHDLSHLIALIVERLYKDDSGLDSFKLKMSTMRVKFAQTDIAAIVPPKGRKKSEHQSFDKIINWSNAALNLVSNKLNDPQQIKYLQAHFETKTLDRVKEELSWISDYSELIIELSALNNAIKEVEKELKHNGLSKISIEKCTKIVAGLTSENGEKFKTALVVKLEYQIQLLPNIDTILFSSDIL